MGDNDKQCVNMSECIEQVQARLGRRLTGLEHQIAITSMGIVVQAYQAKILASLTAMKERLHEKSTRPGQTEPSGT